VPVAPSCSVSSFSALSALEESSALPFSQSAWAAAEADREVEADATGGIGLVITAAATRVSVWDGPWEHTGTTASASGFAGTGGGAAGDRGLSPSPSLSPSKLGAWRRPTAPFESQRRGARAGEWVCGGGVQREGGSLEFAWAGLWRLARLREACGGYYRLSAAPGDEGVG
jgi:hypothetical protein